MMLETLRGLLRDIKYEDIVEDERPNFVFSIPGVVSVAASGFHLSFWIQLVLLILVQSVINVAVGFVVYKYIVLRPKSVTTLVLGYGLVCPALLCLPYAVIEALHLRNLAFKIGSAAGVTLLFFRCIEAMHQCSPPFATRSLKSYLWYYAAVIQFEIDPVQGTTIPITFKYIRAKTAKYAATLMWTSLLYSILLPSKYEYFKRTEITTFLDLFRVGNLLNNFLMASLTSCCLEVGALGIGLATSLVSGMQTVDLNHSPLTKSISPSEFWGKRWNVIVSSALKRGVFVPLRKIGYSRPVAALACFGASGLLHEYLIHIKAFRSDLVPLFGLHLVFFMWNAVVLIVEQLVRETVPMKWIAKNLPRPLRTALVLLTVLPIGHFFTDVYVDLGFYSDYSLGFPKFHYVSLTRA